MVTNLAGFAGRVPPVPPPTPPPPHNPHPKRKGGGRTPKMRDLAPAPWHEWLWCHPEIQVVTVCSLFHTLGRRLFRGIREVKTAPSNNTAVFSTGSRVHRAVLGEGVGVGSGVGGGQARQYFESAFSLRSKSLHQGFGLCLFVLPA